MAYCINCGKELAEKAKFCDSCGVAVDIQKSEKEQRKTIYDGDLHKCPQCGEHLNAFVTKCPVCNYELRGAQATSCVHELAQKLEKTESDDDKTELISNFYIPNTKEDIYEFFVLAYSHITAGGYGLEAWSVKLEQAYLKARLAFGDSEEYAHIKELYDKIHKASKKNKIIKSRLFKASIIFGIGLLMILVGFLVPAITETVGYDDSVPFFLIAFLGLFPFLIGLIMAVIPEKKHRRKTK